MAINKTTRELSMQELTRAFYIGTITVNGVVTKVNELETAIQNGTILALIKECADKLHNGELKPVLDAMLKNLSDYKCRLYSKDFCPDRAQRIIRYNTLQEYVKSLAMNEAKKVSTNKSGKAYWQWTIEDIDSVDMSSETAYRTLKSVYDNMASRKSKYPETIEDLEEFNTRQKYVRAKMSELKETTSKPTVPASLLEKLNSAKAAKLSAEETAQLVELLSKLNK